MPKIKGYGVKSRSGKNNGLSVSEIKGEKSRTSGQEITEALIGFQGRGLVEVIQPDFCHGLFLKALIFQWP